MTGHTTIPCNVGRAHTYDNNKVATLVPLRIFKECANEVEVVSCCLFSGVRSNWYNTLAPAATPATAPSGATR
jgi:hypothetical protein